jgi:hypothetical protein
MCDDTKCVHCGQRIVRVNYALGPGWVHQPEGAAFMDGTHTACHTTVATPPSEWEEADE